MAGTLGVHHVGLSVPDVEKTAAFFVEGLGFEEVRRDPGYPAIFVSDGSTMLSLWQADSKANAFNRKKAIGLHHLALRVDSAERLDALYAKLRQRDGVRIEFPPEPLRGGPSKHMMLYEPGGIRIELIHPVAGVPAADRPS